MKHVARRTCFFLFLSCLGNAHVGSPDIYLNGDAGPYKLFVTIRPPPVIPGVAEILVRSQSPAVTEMKAAAMPLSGVGADHPPVPDSLIQQPGDSQFFTGGLWLMADGSWQVRIQVNGTLGAGTLAVPVPAVAQTIRRMDWQLGGVLAMLGLFLVGGLAAICGATVREAKLEPGLIPAEAGSRKGRRAMLVAACVIALVLFGGKIWWDSEADVYTNRVYKPLNMRSHLESGHNLLLNLSEPGWMQPKRQAQTGKLSRVLFIRKMDDLVLDHNHLMHLYLIRQPGLDVIYHLHPDPSQPDEFRVLLPAMPGGDYNLYADVVHEDGLPETLTSSLHLPEGIAAAGARSLTGDDARAETKPVGSALLGDTFVLPDGYRIRWLRSAAPLHPREGSQFEFELLTPAGGKPADMALYMGMQGHAAFVKTDGTVFAHIHPNGTVSMSAFMLAQGKDSMAAMDHAQMGVAIPNQVSFPYGLPSAGAYRIFVQMKHGETIETGIFDATAR